MKEPKEARMGMIAVAAVMLVSVARRLMGARRLSSGVMVLAGAVLLVAAGSAIAEHACVAEDGTAYFCGDTVLKSCTFNGSMICSSGAGLIIGANDITIDGAGFKITGNRGSISCYGSETAPAEHSGIVNTEYDNVTIKNLEIENFYTGIGLGTWPPVVDNNTVTGCKIHDCGKSTTDATYGIHLVGANYCNITKNEIYNIDGSGVEGGCSGGGNGIFMYGVSKDRGNHNNITYNNLSCNIKSGFFMKMMCMHNIISNNTATGNNEEGGVVLMCMKSNYNTIEGNTASENARYGIFIGGRNNTIRNNSVFNNGLIGIYMGRSDGSYDNELYGNTVCGNSEYDIRTCGPECYGNHGDNNTCNTTSYYNDDRTAGCAYDCEYSEVGCVAEDGTVFRCGDTVTKSCTFNEDMNCHVRYGLIIGADNITIDGAGYTLERADPGECTLCPSAGVLNKGYDDVTIANLEIKHFCNGIYLNRNIEDGHVVYRNTIENCNIHHTGNATASSATHGIKMRYVFNSTIRNNSIHDQIAYVDPNPGCEDGGNGLFLYTGDHNNIIGNRFYNNQKAGMLIKMKPKYWNISHNHLWGNGQGGIILRCKLCDFNLIEHNNASGNYGSGIFIGGNDNTIRYNTVCNNRDGGPYYDDSVGGHGYGINIGRGDGSLDNTLISNTVCGNDYQDIRVVTGVTGNTGGENTCNTTYNYNDDGTTGCTYSCGTTAPSKGDLNDDGTITPADAAIALQMVVRGEYSEDADVSGDHTVTSLDALLILQAAARM